jgi:hypothetical protein
VAVSAEEEAQFECFMAFSRHPGRVVLSLLDDAVLLSCGARQLSPSEQIALESAALKYVPWEHDSVVELTLDTGTTVTARAYTSNNGVAFPGVVLEVLSFDPPATCGPGPFEHLVGESAAWRQLCSEALWAAEARVPVLVAGNPGTGKLAVAEALVNASGTAGLVVFDVGTMYADVPAWMEELRKAIRHESTAVVLRHLERCDGFASVLVSELEHSAAHAWVLATLNEHGSQECPENLLDRFWRVRVPSLDERRDDIPALVAYFIVQRGGDRGLRLHPEAIRSLKTGNYPENIRDLERLAASLIGVVAERGEIHPSDLALLGGTPGALTCDDNAG